MKQISIEQIIAIKADLRRRGYIPDIDMLLEEICLDGCECEKCGAEVKCEHSEKEIHVRSLCGHCAGE